MTEAYLRCAECNTPVQAPAPERCPNPGCRPGMAARNAAQAAWGAACEAWVQAQTANRAHAYNPRAFRETYERDHPRPAGDFPAADPAWLPWE